MNRDEIEKDIIQKLKKIYHISSHGYVVKSGTNALLECLLAIGVNKGDEIILPISICDSVVKAVKNLSIIPVLVDVDRYMGIERSAVEKAITKRTRAVLVWHAYGRVTDIRWINELKQKYGEKLCFIEDCAQVLGAESKEITIGTECEFSIFSFGVSKPVPANGGGVFFVNNRSYETEDNSFTDPVRCVPLHQREMLSIEQLLLINSQLSKIDQIIAEKRLKAEIYYKELRNIGFFLDDQRNISSNVHNRFIIRIPNITPEQYDQIIRKVNGEIEQSGYYNGWEVVQGTINVNESIFSDINRYYLLMNRKDLIQSSTSWFVNWEMYEKQYFYFRTNDFVSTELVVQTCEIFKNVLTEVMKT